MLLGVFCWPSGGDLLAFDQMASNLGLMEPHCRQELLVTLDRMGVSLSSVKTLGCGADGYVYKVRLLNGATCALKIAKGGDDDREEAKAALIHELSIMEVGHVLYPEVVCRAIASVKEGEVVGYCRSLVGPSLGTYMRPYLEFPFPIKDEDLNRMLSEVSLLNQLPPGVTRNRLGFGLLVYKLCAAALMKLSSAKIVHKDFFLCNLNVIAEDGIKERDQYWDAVENPSNNVLIIDWAHSRLPKDIPHDVSCDASKHSPI